MSGEVDIVKRYCECDACLTYRGSVPNYAGSVKFQVLGLFSFYFDSAGFLESELHKYDSRCVKSVPQEAVYQFQYFPSFGLRVTIIFEKIGPAQESNPRSSTAPTNLVF